MVTIKSDTKNTIRLFKEIAKNISSRDVVQRLNPIIQKNKLKRIDIDFNGVEFVSRSAAHELLLIKEYWFHEEQKKLIFQNTNEEVKEMIKAVASSRAIPNKSKSIGHLKAVNIKRIDI